VPLETYFHVWVIHQIERPRQTTRSHARVLSRAGGRARSLALLALLAAVAVLVLSLPAPAQAAYPRIANIYFPDLSTADLGSLARWDVLILPKRAGDTSQAEMAELRTLNPDIILIAHMPVGYHGDWTWPPINGDLVAELNANDWWLRNTAGERMMLTCGDAVLNETVWCPDNGEGDRLCDWMPEYIAERLGPGGPWDGVFLDYCMDEIAWVNRDNPLPADANGDGIADDPDELNAAWREGMETLTLRLRELVGSDFIVTTNGNNTFYDQCNGSTREGFPHMHGEWLENMTNPEWGYQAICTKFRGPVLSTVNTMWDGPVEGGELVRDDVFERKFRFTFASTLVYGNGYYSFDGGEGLPEHSQDWWHDWYDVDLGMPLGRSEEVVKSDEWVENAQMLRARRFERGIVIVNPTTVTQTVQLPGVYAPLDAFNGLFYPHHALCTNVVIDRQSGALLTGSGQLPLMQAGVSWTRGDADAVTLTWEPVDGAVAYSVYRSHRPEGTLNPAYLETTVQTSSFIDTVDAWESAFYRVAPIDEMGCEGPLSEIVAVRPGRAVGSIGGGDGGSASDLDDSGRVDGTGIGEGMGEARMDEEYPWGCTVDVDGAVEPRGDSGALERDDVAGPVRLVGVSPNPALCLTRVAFHIDPGSPPGKEPVVRIYDIRGRLVYESTDGRARSGNVNVVQWDLKDMRGSRVPAGCYLVAVEGVGEPARGKVVVMPEN